MTGQGETADQTETRREFTLGRIGLFAGLDSGNPFALKDLAGAMRGKLPAVILAICLITVLATVLHTMLVESGGVDGENYGTTLANRTLKALIGLSITLVPFHVFVSTILDVRSRAIDDIILAGATASQLVFGRLQFAFIALLLMASVFAPSFAAAHNLGGVTISKVLLGIESALVSGMPISAAALLFAVHARFRSVGALIPVLFLSGFWVGLASLTLGVFLSGVLVFCPDALRPVLKPAMFAAMFTLCFAFAASMVLAMPGDGLAGSFGVASARDTRLAAARRRVAKSADTKPSASISGGDSIPSDAAHVEGGDRAS